MNSRGTMRKRSAWLAMLAIVLGRAVFADGPATQNDVQPTTEPTPRVLGLVADLTSDEFAVRQKAQQDLEQMGQPVLPQLQAILNGPLSDEARTRVRTAMRRISDERQFGPSVITIHCTDAPLEGVLEDFAQQASAEMGVHRPEIRGYLQSHKITLNLDHADFWTALQTIEDGSGLHARPENSGRLILDDAPGGFWMGQMGDRSRARVAGPCLIAPATINWSMQYANNISNLNLQIVAAIEPKLRMVGGFQPNWLRECVDDKGHSLISPNAQFGGGFSYGPQQWITYLNANLRAVPGMGTKIARLKGELDFQVQTKSETIVIDNIQSAQNVSRNVAGSVITVQQLQSQGGQYQLHLLISGPLVGPNSQFFQNGVTEFQVFDDNNQTLQQVGCNQNIDSPGHATLVLFYTANGGWQAPNLPPVGPPRKLQCEVTTESRPMTERFELDDLPLVPNWGNQ